MTLCHLLGNGSFILITIDDNAESAHVKHGDIYPQEENADECPPTSPDATLAEDDDADDIAGDIDTTDTTTTTTDTTRDSTRDTTVEVTDDAEVLGVEQEAGDELESEVLGIQAWSAGVDRVKAAPADGVRARTAPFGLLPATGAGQFGLALLAGFGLLAAGATVLARRRPQSSR